MDCTLVEEGEYVDSVHLAGCLLPTIHIECHDCGRTFTYNRWGHLPKWVDAMLEKVTRVSEGE